jgi:outer membrane protein assembly factor BamA
MRHVKLGLLVFLLSVATVFPSEPPKTSDQLRLINEAERKHYSLRRIEFIGNKDISDDVLRRSTRRLREGDRFRRSALRESLASLSSLKNIKPVRMRNIKVQLDQSEKVIDITIPITERRRR